MLRVAAVAALCFYSHGHLPERRKRCWPAVGLQEGTTWILPSPSRWHGRQTESSLGEPQDRLQRECRKRAVEDCASAAVATAAAGIGCTAQGETRAKAQSKSSGNLKNKITSTIKHKHGGPCVLFEGAFIFTQRVESGSQGTVLDLGSRRRIEHPSGSFSFLFFLNQLRAVANQMQLVLTICL